MIVENLIKDIIKSPQINNCTTVRIATALVSKKAVEILFRQLKNKPKIELLVGIHVPSDIAAFEHLLDLVKEGDSKVGVKIFTKAFFHPKTYIFQSEDQCVAYIGSGNFTHGGTEKNVELFYKSIDNNFIEELNSWFLSHYAEAIDLDTNFIKEYGDYLDKNSSHHNSSTIKLSELLRKIKGDELKKIDFSHQYFKYDDFNCLLDINASSTKRKIIKNRENLQDKLLNLNNLIKDELNDLNLYPHYRPENITSGINPKLHRKGAIKGMWLHYGRFKSKNAINKVVDGATPLNFMRMELVIHSNSVSIYLRISKKDDDKNHDRIHLIDKIKKQKHFVKTIYNEIKKLPNDYFLKINGQSKFITEFTDENQLKNFILEDRMEYYLFFAKEFALDSPDISTENITTTITDEFRRLLPLYNLIKFTLD